MGWLVNSPIKWFGGKGKMTAKLVPLIPRHNVYVEPFGGGASLLFAKEPSPVEVYNDIDEGLVAFFQVLRSPELFSRFHAALKLTPLSRSEYRRCRDAWRDEPDPVERARSWFAVARQSFGGRFGSGWVTSLQPEARRWRHAVDGLRDCHERLALLTVESKDGILCIEPYDSPDTFFYCDPPYIASSRKSGGYDNEMTDVDHGALLETLQGIEGMAMISGYDSELYKPLVRSGWEIRQWDVACHAAGRTKASGLKGAGKAREKQSRTECVWLNPRAIANQQEPEFGFLRTGAEDVGKGGA
jgi:DNA adenine methylase